MKLYILRHADADTVADSDDARRLSEKGLEQSRKVGRFCEANNLSLSLVLTSPVRRAHETALIVSDHLRAELLVQPWLACGMAPQTALDELAAYRTQNSVMLVGHQPDLSQLIAHLLGLPSGSQIDVKKASLTLFELHSLRPGSARLEFSLPCRLM